MAAVRRRFERLDRGALGEAWRALLWSRLLVVGLGIYAWLRLNTVMQEFRGPPSPEQARVFHAFDTWPARGVLRALFEPLAVWDSSLYVAIAQQGYSGHDVVSSPAFGAQPRAVFFPLYPFMARVASLFVHSTGAVLIGAYLVSLVSLFGALYLLHRLTTLELGREAAGPALLVLAFFPTALALGAPYTESLFLLLSIGCIYAARTGHWAWAGLLAGAATATRNSGLALIVPFVVLYLWGPRSDRPAVAPLALSGGRRAGVLGLARRLRPRYALRWDALWIAAPVAVLGGWMVYLNGAVGDAFAWSHGQAAYGRVSASPLTGVRGAFTSAWHAIQGHATSAFFDFGSLNVLNLVFFLAAIAALVGVFRRLPIAYGLYVLPTLMLPLTAPRPDQPIAAMIRYVLSMFPLFMWLGAVCAERRMTAGVVGVFAAFLGVLTVQFVGGQFVF